MDPTAEEQIDYEDEEYGVNQKMQYQGAGAISALADEEMMGEDDEYDDLYNDVNVGEGFLQMHRSEAPPPANVGNGGLQARKIDAPVPNVEAGSTHGLSNSGVAVEGKYSNTGTRFPEQGVQLSIKEQGLGSVGYPDGSAVSQKGQVMEIAHDAQVRNVGFQGSTSLPPNIGADIAGIPGRMPNIPAPALNSSSSVPQGIPQIQTNQTGMNINVNRINENEIRPSVDNGLTMLYVGELHWWTTDAELESVLSQYGRVKEIKFFDERASGKSKGYCQVEFYDPTAAAACKEGMNGHLFNGRACVAAFASPQTLKQMGASYSKNQPESQPQPQGRRPMNDGMGRGNNMNYQGGDGGRNYGRGSWGRGGQGMLNRGPGGGGHMRGRGGMGAKNMGGPGIGGPAGGGGPGGYGQGLAGPAFGGPAVGMMQPQGMMGAGFDPSYMGRGGYGGFSGPGFPGMLPSFPGVNAMGLAGVAPHVNPAFFARGMAPNGMGMMGSSMMEGHHAGMWADSSMGAWGGDEHGGRTRESSYGGDDGASEYGYGEANHEKGVRSSAASREKDRGSDHDWSGNTDRRQRDEREQDWDRPEREHRHREEKDNHRDHRQRERDSGYKDDWDRGQSSSRPRSRSRAMPEENHRSRSRDVDYGKRRRLPSE